MIQITRGDSMPLSVDWYVPDDDNPLIAEAAIVSSATVRLVRLRDELVLIEDEAADVESNETSYLVLPEYLHIVGPYAAFITATFSDSNVQTKRIDFYVTYKR